jgi:hypothetical protein
MKRFLAKTALLCTLLVTACIGLIRAQPHNDSELRAFLTPSDDCLMPCFMGVRPGVTTTGEAIAVLEAHPWVEGIQVTGTYIQNLRIVRWSGRQPAMIDRARYATFRTSRGGKIDEIYVPLTLNVGYLYLALGEPSSADFLPVVPIPGSRAARVILPMYDRSLIRLVSAPVQCPLSLESFWKAPADISIMSEDLRSDLIGVEVWNRRNFDRRNPEC